MKDYKRLEAEMMYWRACYNYLRERMEYLLEQGNDLDSMSDIEEILENIEGFTDLDVLEGFDGTQEYIDRCVKNKVLKKQKEREDYDKGYQDGFNLGFSVIDLLESQDGWSFGIRAINSLESQDVQIMQIMQKVQKMLKDKEKPYNEGFEKGYKAGTKQKRDFIESNKNN